MAIVGYSSRGGGPGGVLPLSLGDGDLLVGDAAGTWHAGQNLPVGVGAVPFWDGGAPGRYRYSAAPNNGDVLVFNAGTGLWVPQAPTAGAFNTTLAFGAGSILANPALTFLYPWYDASGGATTEAIAGQLTAPNAGTISRMWVRHGSLAGASDITYTLLVNSVASALVLVLNSATASGSNLVNAVAVAAGDRLTVQCSTPGGAPLLTVRPAVQFQFQA